MKLIVGDAEVATVASFLLHHSLLNLKHLQWQNNLYDVYLRIDTVKVVFPLEMFQVEKCGMLLKHEKLGRTMIVVILLTFF